MAEVQVFEPEFNEIFTDRGWRAAFAGRTGVVCDTDGSAFGLTLPAEGSTAELGSPSQPSRLVVDGFGLEVPAATTQSLDIPASVGGGTNGRTDLIVGRLTTGPVNLELYRIPGTEGSTARPAASYDPTGTRDLLLYAIRRREGEGLNQAIVTDWRPRIGLHYLVPVGATLPANAPLGDTATRDGTRYRRDFVESAVDWVAEVWPVSVTTGIAAIGTGGTGWTREPESRIERQGPRRTLHGEVEIVGPAVTASGNGGVGDPLIARLAVTSDRPPVDISTSARVLDTAGATYQAGVVIEFDGQVRLISTNPNVAVRRVIWDATWWTS